MNKRPTITFTDTNGNTFDASTIQVVKDGKAWRLALTVEGVLVTFDPSHVSSVALAGFGDDVSGGSDLSPFGFTMNTVAGEATVDDDTLTDRVVEAIKSGRVTLVDSQKEARRRSRNGGQP